MIEFRKLEKAMQGQVADLFRPDGTLPSRQRTQKAQFLCLEDLRTARQALAEDGAGLRLCSAFARAP